MVYFNVVRFLHEEQAKNVSSILNNYADTLDQFFRDNEASLYYLSDNTALKRVSKDPAGYEQELEQRFQEFQYSHSEIKLISYGTEQGQYFFDPGSNQVPAGYDPRVRPWYLKAKEVGPDAIGYSDIYRDINTGDYIITMVKQVQDEEGNFAGVLGILLDLGYFSERNAANRIGDTGYTFITRNGTYFVNNAQELINTEIEIPEFRQISLDKQSSSFQYDTGKEVMLVQAQYEPRADLTFWAIAHESELLAPYWTALRDSILLILLILFLTILLVIRISKTLVREMGVLTKISKEMANGNLSARIHVESSDEMQIFANHFNLMAEQIEMQTNALIKNLLKLDQSYRETITMLSNAIEASDEYTKGHCERVAMISMILGCGIPQGCCQHRPPPP